MNKLMRLFEEEWYQNISAKSLSLLMETQLHEKEEMCKKE